jgi:hypothetical protein
VSGVVRQSGSLFNVARGLARAGQPIQSPCKRLMLFRDRVPEGGAANFCSPVVSNGRQSEGVDCKLPCPYWRAICQRSMQSQQALAADVTG